MKSFVIVVFRLCNFTELPIDRSLGPTRGRECLNHHEPTERD